jgi:hypothetical protein
MPGANPTFAECWTQLGLAVKVVNEVDKFANANTPNYVTMEDALVVALDGVFTPSAFGSLRGLVRSGLNRALTPTNLRGLFRPFLQEMCRKIDSPELQKGGAISDATMLRVIRQAMHDGAANVGGATQKINSRGMTLDVAGATSGSGSGAVHRLTVDKDGYTLEATGPEDKVFYCDLDQLSTGGSRHAEVFEFRPGAANEDNLYWSGSGSKGRTITSLHAKSASIVTNPSFDQGASTSGDGVALTTTTQLTGWTAGTAANIKTRSSSDYVYRGFKDDTGVTHYGLEFTGSTTLTQVLRTASPGGRLDPRVPVYVQVAWKRLASATGNLTVRFGASSATVAIGTGTNGVWNILKIAVGTGNYYQNFNEADLDVQIEVDTLATGTVVVDDFVSAPYVMLDGTWWAVVGGVTPWKRGDTVTFDADADGGTRAIFSYWFWRTYGDDLGLLIEMRGWLPSDNGGTETIADPS